MRKIGIDAIGTAPWGTHFCVFHQQKADLIDLLVLYFSSGLEQNEFCVWVTSGAVDANEAEAALSEAVPDLKRRLERGQMAIVPHSEWYLKGGEFQSRRAVGDWIGKLTQALKNGCNGMRVATDTAWVGKEYWGDFTAYEKELNSVIGKYQMMAACAYCLDGCTSDEMLDVFSNHQFALARRDGEWKILGSPYHKRPEDPLGQKEDMAQTLLNAFGETMFLMDAGGTAMLVNNATAERLGRTVDELTGSCMYGFLPHGVAEVRRAQVHKVIRARKPITFQDERAGRTFETTIHPVPDVTGKVSMLAVFARDITDRKRAEERLQESEEGLRLAFENAVDAIFWADPETGVITNCNAAAEKLLERERGEIIGQHQTILHPPQQAEYYGSMFREHVEKGGAFDDEAGVITKSGKTKPVHITASVTRVGTKAIMQGIFRDITQRKRAEEALRRAHDELEIKVEERTEELSKANRLLSEQVAALKRTQEYLRKSEEQLQLVTDVVPALISYVDSEQHYRFNNRGYEEWFGHSREEVYGKHIKDVLGESAYGTIEKYVKAALSGRQVSFEGLVPYKDGGARWVSATYIPHEGIDGQVEGFFVLVQDITERKQAEEMYRNLIESAPMAIGIASVDEGAILLVNKAAERTFGFSQEEFLTRRVRDIYMDPGDQKKLRQQLKSRGTVKDFETVLLRKDGSAFPALINSAAIDWAGQKCVETMIFDISDIKHAEAELRSMSQRIVRAQEEAMTRVSRELHDELGQLATAALYSLQLHKDSLRETKFPPDRIDHALDAVLKLEEAIRQTGARIRSPLANGRGLEESLRDLASEFERYGAAEVDLIMPKKPVAPPEHICVACYRVVQEALNNVAKHAKARKASINLFLQKGDLVLEIEDNGVGFDVARAEETGTMGITNMRERTELCGGSFRITARRGKGTKLVARFPLDT